MSPRAADLGLAAIAVGYAALLLWTEAGRGFPDGHLTELDRALRLPRVLAAGVALGLGVVLARGGGRAGARGACGLGLGLLVVVERWIFPAVGAALGLAGGGGG